MITSLVVNGSRRWADLCRTTLETIFSNSATGKRGIAHELHSLATTTLDVARQTAPDSADDSWSPKQPGVTLAAISGAAAPPKPPAQRLAQMRSLAREFSGTTEDPNKIFQGRIIPPSTTISPVPGGSS